MIIAIIEWNFDKKPIIVKLAIKCDDEVLLVFAEVWVEWKGYKIEPSINIYYKRFNFIISN